MKAYECRILASYKKGHMSSCNKKPADSKLMKGRKGASNLDMHACTMHQQCNSCRKIVAEQLKAA